MRHLFQAFSLVAALSLPLTAGAATMDLITINGGSFGTYTLTVPATPTSFTANTAAGSIELFNVPVTGPSYSANDTVFFFNTVNGGGLLDFNVPVLNLIGPSPFNIGPSLFNDSLTAPSFLLGSGTLDYYLPPSFTTFAPFTYDVTEISTTPTVPEPSSLWLLGTGALGAAGLLRRRIFAVNQVVSR